MTVNRILAAGLVVVLAAACATITKGTDQQVSVDTPGYPGAKCSLTSRGIGNRSIVTPALVTLPKSKFDIAVSCEAACAKGEGVIVSGVEAMTAGNVLAGGVIGLGVDSASGALNKYTERNSIAMVPVPGCST
jgi:hypothetical protein